jgi:hypothetical protein
LARLILDGGHIQRHNRGRCGQNYVGHAGLKLVPLEKPPGVPAEAERVLLQQMIPAARVCDPISKFSTKLFRVFFPPWVMLRLWFG